MNSQQSHYESSNFASAPAAEKSASNSKMPQILDVEQKMAKMKAQAKQKFGNNQSADRYLKGVQTSSWVHKQQRTG